MKKSRAPKRAKCREIDDDESIDNILENHYKKTSFIIKNLSSLTQNIKNF